MPKTSPPLGKKILRRILPFAERETLIGDFDELFLRMLRKRGRLRAEAWFWSQVIMLLPGTLGDSIRWRSQMLGNYFKIAWRNIKKYKSYSLINFAGLTLGITCASLIVLFVRFEAGFDKFHRRPGEIFRIVMHQDGNSFGGTDWLPWTPPILATTLRKDIPAVETAARFKDSRKLVAYRDKKNYEEHFCYADPELFDIFSFSAVQGDPRAALSGPFRVLITRGLAEKYFGREDPLGRTIRVDNQYDYQITGVIENCPGNTHLQFNFIASFITLKTTEFQNRPDFDQWGMNFHDTYFRIRRGADAAGIERSLAKYSSVTPQGKTWSFHVQPLLDIHLKGIGNRKGESDIRTMAIFSVTGILLLLIACFNYMNLSTARSMVRAREIGVRKVVGAERSQLVRQFLGESLIFSSAAAIVSILLADLILPVFSRMVDKKMSFDPLSDVAMVGLLLGLAAACGLLSGSYPALLLSSFHPVKILKGNPWSGSKRTSVLRKSLVVAQFVISIGLMICTLAVSSQLDYIKNKNLGFQKDHIITLAIQDPNFRKKPLPFENELSGNPRIAGVASSEWLPIQIGSLAQAAWAGKPANELRQIRLCPVDAHFIDFYGMEMVKGRPFAEDRTADIGSYILNETAVREFGFERPIGTRIKIWGREGEIIGVIKDFHSASLHLPIEPVALKLDPSAHFNISVKIASDSIPETLAFIEKAWKKYSPEYPFAYSFLDDRIDLMYKADQKLGRSFRYFSAIAIFIACLGLVGLASFSTERRTREIGIRKVLGASLPNVLFLLSKEVLFLVVTAGGLAWGIAYFVMRNWLRNFAYRVELSVWLFILSGLAALVIALLTISFYTVRAAKASPVEALKYE